MFATHSEYYVTPTKICFPSTHQHTSAILDASRRSGIVGTAETTPSSKNNFFRDVRRRSSMRMLRRQILSSTVASTAEDPIVIAFKKHRQHDYVHTPGEGEVFLQNVVFNKDDVVIEDKENNNPLLSSAFVPHNRRQNSNAQQLIPPLKSPSNSSCKKKNENYSPKQKQNVSKHTVGDNLFETPRVKRHRMACPHKSSVHAASDVKSSSSHCKESSLHSVFDVSVPSLNSPNVSTKHSFTKSSSGKIVNHLGIRIFRNCWINQFDRSVTPPTPKNLYCTTVV